MATSGQAKVDQYLRNVRMLTAAAHSPSQSINPVAASSNSNANPNYAAIMAASDPRRESINAMAAIQAQPAPIASRPVADTGPTGPGTYSYTGPSALEMATKEFGPQFALLAQQRGQATTNYNKAGSDVGSMYDALAKAMHGNTATIQNQYKHTGDTIGGAYNSAVASTNKGFSDSRQEIADLAQRLGVSQALPSALQGGSEQQSRLIGLLNANKANNMSTNTSLGQNDVSYNNQQANSETMAGVNARSDFKDRLLSYLQGNDNQKLQLQGNKSSAENKYGMDILNMTQSGQNSLNTNYTNQQRNNMQNEIAQANAMVNQQNADTKQYAAQNPNTPAVKQNAYQTLADSAAQIYPGDVHSQNKAAQIISEMFTNGTGGNDTFTSASDFVRKIMLTHPEMDGSKIQQLATMFYATQAGGAGKPYTG